MNALKRGLMGAVAAVVIGGGVAHAGTCTWKATTTGQNFNGSTANWSCGNTPQNSDDVVFDGSISNQSCGFTSTITVNSVTFQNGYSGSVTGSASALTVASVGWIMPTGTFVGGGGTISIAGSLSVSGTASFTAGTGTTQIGGNFTNAATFNPNGGTVKLVSTSASTLTSGGAVFKALTVNGAGGTYTQQDALTTTGTLTVTAGTLTAGANAVTIGGGLTLNGGTFNASSGTTAIAGAFNRSSGTFNANGGTVYFNGTTTLSHTFGGSTLNNVQMGFGTSGLVGYWNLDEASGTTATDSSGSSDTGTLSGSTSRTTAVPAKISFADPEALTLSGGVVTLGVTNLPANNAPQSISLWFQGAPNGGNENMIAMGALGSSSAVQLGYRGSSLIAWNYGGGTLVSATAPNDSNWHQVIYVYDGTTDSLYLDGALAATSTTSTHQTATPTSAYLGTYDGSSEKFAGSLDDVRVYNRAINSAEITVLSSGAFPSTLAGTHTFSDAFACTGNFSILAGSLAGSSTLSVGGNWFNAGTYTDSGQVTMTGTSASGTITSGGGSFGALTFNGSGGTYKLVDALSTTRDFKITAGTVTGTQTVTCGGSWSNSGVFGDTGAVTLTSTASKTILSGGSRFSSGLTINGVGGTYTISDRLWVPGGTITVTNGTLNGGSSIIHVGTLSLGAGGAFAAGTGTVIFDGTASQTLPASSFSGLRLEDTSESNLVGYWKLDENQTTTVHDVSGSGNNGTVTSTTWQTTVPATVGFDDAASLNFGGAAYVTLGATNVPNTDAAMTISAWVNFTSPAGTTQNMVALAGAGGNYVQLGLRGGTYTAWPSGAGTTISGPAATTGWHHVAYTYNGASVDTLYIDGVASTGSFTHQSGATTTVYLGNYSTSLGTNELLNGSLDDVRIYNAALTSSQIAQLAAGRYAGTGGYATTTLSANTTVTGLLALDASVLNANGKTMAAGATGPVTALVNCGTYTVGSAAQTFSGGLTVQPPGALTLASSGGSVQIASGQTLTIDGTLNASSSSATIQGVAAASYTFKVGSTSTVTPTLNISALAVKNTSGGMQIGASTAATTTFTRFDNVAFSGGTGAQYLLINAKTLFLSSSGCTFDSGSATGGTTKAVTAAGDGTANGETRAVFGGTNCATNWALSASDLVCTTTAKSDDDADNNGVGNTPATNGAVVEFVRSAEDDTAGSIVGFPTAAFNWNTFSYYSTYAAFHNASSGTSDVVYVRDGSGNPLYSWTVPTAGETITGTPQWNSKTVTGVTTYYVFVATNAGHVYKLIDTATGTTSGTLTLDGSGSWATNPYSCGCTIGTPLALDANNVYWGSTTPNQFWTLGQPTESHPTPVTITPVVTSASLATATISSTVYTFMGVTNALLQITGNAVTKTNNSTGSVNGRIVVGTNASGVSRVYAGDDGGKMWAVDPTTGFTSSLWSYPISGDQIKSSPYYDYGTDTIHYGTQNGAINVLGATGAVLNASYPYTPSSGDPITASPLYVNGVLVVGSTGGKLYFLDRNTGTVPGVSILKEYYFGASESVSGVAFDPNQNRYMVTTSSASANDGRLYYFDLVTDPTVAK